MPPLGLLPWGKPAAQGEAAPWRSPWAEGLTPADTHRCELRNGLFLPHWGLQTRPQPQSTVLFHLMRDPQPELPGEAVPRFLTHGNYEMRYVCWGRGRQQIIKGIDGVGRRLDLGW